MSQALLAIQNISQKSNIFDRSRETVLFTPFGDKKVTQFSGFPPTSVSYLKSALASLDIDKMRAANESYAFKMNIIAISVALGDGESKIAQSCSVSFSTPKSKRVSLKRCNFNRVYHAPLQ